MASRKTPRRKPAEARPPARFPIVCIGASAGGLDAFSRLLESLTTPTGMGFVIIQHLEPHHASLLPPLLAKKSPMPVQEASEGIRIRPDHVYVIPPGRLLTLSDDVLKLETRASGTKALTIDHFMQSLARQRGRLAIGVVLSGTASDGTAGLEAIKAAGGTTFAQDEPSAQYAGMPSSAAASGVVDFILPPEKIAEKLMRISRRPDADRHSGLDVENVGVAGRPEQFAEVFELLQKATGLDFRSYKGTTIRRRIARRMSMQKLSMIDAYISHLKKTPAEVEALSQDLLIKVTTFFRDAPAFEALKKKVVPAILRHKKQGDVFRVWVPGCSTGEEVYSIGMTLIEAVDELAPGLPCQLFATDISEPALAKARAGYYADTITEQVSPERLRRFFLRTAEGYRIAKSVRDLCIFARQDLTKDAPFSKLDLISCRNVLIYMGSDLQKRILPIFHYALKPGGFLMLGSAESPGSFAPLFSIVDKRSKIYAKKQVPTQPRLDYPALLPLTPRVPTDKRGRKDDVADAEADLFREVDKITLARFSPPGVLLNDELEVLQFRGHTGPYLDHAPGKPTVNILRMVREGMAFELRKAAEKALKKTVQVRTRPVEIKHDGHTREVVIDVVPIRTPLSGRPFLLAMFTEAGPAVRKGKGASPTSEKGEVRLAAQLRRELSAVREELQSVIEEQEAAQEEFKSANEEILSSNEELQSTNEELETAKEELQSANEELTTLNEELLTRNAELGQLNSDITNLLASINIPILMLSHDLRIRRFTPVAGSLLNLIPGDVGRPITDINPAVDLPNLAEAVAAVIDTMAVHEREVRTKDGRWYSLRIRPYRTLENRIDGATVTLVDIDAVKKSQQADAIAETIREPLLVLDQRFRIKSVNRAFCTYFQTSAAETVDKGVFEAVDGQLDAPPLRTLLQDVLPKQVSVEDYKVEHTFSSVGKRRLMVNARRLRSQNDEDELILLALQDSTPPEE
jgi:two-component system, chemotaxis family, CheB/CheR fusion protein